MEGASHLANVDTAFVCVCVHLCVCARAYVCVWVCVHACTHARIWLLYVCNCFCNTGILGVYIVSACVDMICFLCPPGLFPVWRRNQRQQSPAGSHYAHHRYTGADVLLRRRKPWALEDTVCAGCFQTAEETGPVSWCGCVLPPLLVRQNWNWRGRGDELSFVDYVRLLLWLLVDCEDFLLWIISDYCYYYIGWPWKLSFVDYVRLLLLLCVWLWRLSFVEYVRLTI